MLDNAGKTEKHHHRPLRRAASHGAQCLLSVCVHFSISFLNVEVRKPFVYNICWPTALRKTIAKVEHSSYVCSQITHHWTHMNFGHNDIQ